MIKKIGFYLLMAGLVLAVYRLSGGDLGVALQHIIDFLVVVVNKLADFFVYLIHLVNTKLLK